MKKKRNIAIVIIAAVLILGGAALYLTLFNGDTYRNIAVSEMNSITAVINRGGEEFDAYEGMLLQSGDKVRVGSSEDGSGYVFLKLDDDKYVMVEPDTVLSVYSTGSPEKGDININVENGGVTNKIDNKLNEDSSYEVTTPGATMAVRGTIYRIVVVVENGKVITDVQVLEGEVETSLVDGEGNVTGQTILTMEGSKTRISKKDSTIEYQYENEELTIEDIPTNVLKKVQEFIKEKRISSFLSAYAEEDIQAEIDRREEASGSKDNKGGSQSGNAGGGAADGAEAGHDDSNSPESSDAPEGPLPTTASSFKNTEPEADNSSSATDKPAETKQPKTDNGPKAKEPKGPKATKEPAGENTLPTSAPDNGSQTGTEPTEHTVSFYSGGVLWATQVVKEGDCVIKPMLYPKGTSVWYSNAACTMVYDFAGKKVTADINIYAK